MTTTETRRAFRPLGDTGQVQRTPVSVDRTALQVQAREAVLANSETLNELLELILAGLSGREEQLDPYYPADLRYAAIAEVLRPIIAQHKASGGPLQHVPTDLESIRAYYAATIGMGIVQRYLDDPHTNEVKIGGKSGCEVMVQTSGQGWRHVQERFATREQALAPIRFQASRKGIPLDETTSMQTIPGDYGTRIHVSINPRVAQSHLICIRRGRESGWRVRDVRERGSLDDRVQRVLLRLIRARLGILISGVPGAGKTALLESILNDWPLGDHIITAEDRTLDLAILEHFWTQIYVEGPSDFDLVAREVLRMTPSVLVPGEMRGLEAGAFLAMALSGCALASTIHAPSLAAAPERFAIYAALPGAYQYDGLYEVALDDICQSIQLLIHVKNWQDLGLRGIAEVALLDGTRRSRETGRLEPNIIPIIRAVRTPAGIIWDSLVDVDATGNLIWLDGDDRMPAAIQERLADSALGSSVAPVGTVLEGLQAAVLDAQQYLDQGDAESALNVLQHMWQERRDAQLVSMAQQALARGGTTYEPLRAEALARRAHLTALIEARRWGAADALYQELTADLRQVAAALPPGGWQPLIDQVEASMREAAAFERSCAEAQALLGERDPRRALERINQIQATGLPSDAELAVLALREQALQQLVERGEGRNTRDMLDLLRIRRQALQAQA